MFLRFILVAVCLAVVSGGPVSPDDSPTSDAPSDVSVATSGVTDVEAPKLQHLKISDEGSKESHGAGPPPNSVIEEKKTDTSSENGSPPNAIVEPLALPASEVGDMMKDPYHHINQSTPSPGLGEVGEINNETVTVNDPHVNKMNKTHEEEEENKTKVDEASTEAPQGSSTQVAQESSTQESPSASTLETITDKAKEEEKPLQNNENKSDLSEEKSESNTTVTIKQVPTLPVSALVAQHDSHPHPIGNKGSTLNHTTQVAAILAGALVTIALLGYVGLLVWRRVLERRYGNREMLVNEDDDFKHFEL